MAFLKNVWARSETFAKALRARAYAPCPRTGWESAAPPASRQAPPASRQAPPVRRGRLAVGFSQQFRQDHGGLHQYFPPIASVHTSRCLNWLLSVLAWRRLPPASAISCPTQGQATLAFSLLIPLLSHVIPSFGLFSVECIHNVQNITAYN